MKDRSNLRWIFNRHSVSDPSNPMSRSPTLYIDARVLDDDVTPAILAEISRLSARAPNRKLIRDLSKNFNRIVDRLRFLDDQGLMSEYLTQRLSAGVKLAAAFSAIRVIDRPILNTVEYVLRTPEEERRALALWSGDVL